MWIRATDRKAQRISGQEGNAAGERRASRSEGEKGELITPLLFHFYLFLFLFLVAEAQKRGARREIHRPSDAPKKCNYQLVHSHSNKQSTSKVHSETTGNFERKKAHRDNSFLAGLEAPGETTHGPTQEFAQRRPHLPLCFEGNNSRLDFFLVINFI